MVMLEPTRGPPGPSMRSVEKMSRTVDWDVALLALSQALVRDEPVIKLVVCQSEAMRASLIYKYEPAVIDERYERVRLLGVCFEGVGDLPRELRDLPAEDILYYRSGAGLWVVVVDEPDEERAVELVRRVCGSYTRRPIFYTGFELREVC